MDHLYRWADSNQQILLLPPYLGKRLVVAATVFGFVTGQAKGLVSEELVGGGVDGGADGNAV